MATTDIYTVMGSLQPFRHAIRGIGADADTGLKVDTLAAALVTANYTSGTITMWVMVPDETGTYGMIGFGDASAVEYIEMDIAAGKLHAKCARVGPDVAWDIITTTKVIKPHQWTHIAITHDSAKPRLYVNGVLQTVAQTDITEPTYWFDTCSLIDGAHIGCIDSVAGDAAVTAEFKGYISTVKVWGGLTTTAALTDAQIKEEYDGIAHATYLVAEYDMDGNVINRANDGTYNGTLETNSVYCDACEFTSRFTFGCGIALVADDVQVSINNNLGLATVIQAA